MAKHKHWEVAYRAHCGTSFVPEKRADEYCAEFDEQLELGKVQVAELGGDPQDYAARYERLWLAWMSAKSRCISTMITGGSNFPVRRAEKANNAEHARMLEFSNFKDGYIQRLQKAQRKAERASIDPIEEKRKELAEAKALQELMKACNVIVRKKIAREDKVAQMVAIGLPQEQAEEILENNFWGTGFPRFKLSNNLARIKDMEQRLDIMEKKAATPVSETERPDGIRVVQNTEADRLQIFFPDRPSKEQIATLKSNAFKWSPSNGCWQRQLTPNAIAALKRVL